MAGHRFIQYYIFYDRKVGWICTSQTKNEIPYTNHHPRLRLHLMRMQLPRRPLVENDSDTAARKCWDLGVMIQPHRGGGWQVAIDIRLSSSKGCKSSWESRLSGSLPVATPLRRYDGSFSSVHHLGPEPNGRWRLS